MTEDLKEIVVNYVGNKEEIKDGNVTVDHVVKVMSEEFPEFLLLVAEQNWVRGYTQALEDKSGRNNLIEKNEKIHKK